ncbi:MAG: T9SS type A sorting domain-containing protein [Bacteroidota bacterium]
MKKYYLLSTLFLCSLTSLRAQNITYADDIAEIIYAKCASCHRAGEIGPMALSNYEQVQAWGGMIQYVTSNKIMPPWQPDPTYSTFRGESYLTDEEIAKISEWVDDGMPRGVVANEPAFPDFPEGSVLGQPDLVLTMEEAWLHEGTGEDSYRYFVFPTDFPEDKIIKAVEFRPGNSKIVHHALVFEDASGQAAANDAATPEYGFDGFGSFTGGTSLEILNQKQFPGYVPGQKPIRFPDGTGQVLQAGADIVIQVHYAPWPVDETDQSSINIFFMDETEEVLEREIGGHIMVPVESVIGEWFIIPANQVKTFHGTFEVPIDISLVNIAPHMHLLGKAWEIWMEKPDGEIVNLIKINDWDFNWQGTYNFDRYQVAPAGTVIHAKATYDNTTSNPNNPSSPPQTTSWGEGTEDEMYFLPIGYVVYEPGDENIVFTDNTTSTQEVANDGNEFYPIRPNPVGDFTVTGFSLQRGQPLTITLFDLLGNRVRTLHEAEFFNTGVHYLNFSTRHLPAGTYVLQVSGKEVLLTQQFVKQ